MLVTVTLNPSVDRRYMIRNFQAGKVFRTSQYEATAGGKGLNVARVLSSLGEEVFATGLLGGKSGEFIEEQLTRLNIKHDFVKIRGETRSCIAILSDDGVQTEILESGAEVSAEEVERFLQHYEKILEQSPMVVASGSILRGMPKTIYYDLIQKAKAKNVRFILDTSGEPLKEGIKAGPYLVKPNKEELEGIVNHPLASEREIVAAAYSVSRQGIDFVVVSLGGAGSIVVHKEKIYRVYVPKVIAKNPVGSGDAMVAGFAFGFARNYDIKDTIAFAAACGTANAMDERTGCVKPEWVHTLVEQIRIEEMVLSH